MPKPTHLYLHADELHDVIVDAMRAFVLNTRHGIPTRPAAEAAIDLAISNALDAYADKLAHPFLRTVAR